MSKFSEYAELQKKYMELGEKLSKAKDDFERTIPLQKLRKIYYFVDSENKIKEAKWNGKPQDLRRYNVDSVFETLEQAEKEQLKRIAIGKIERFRKECYGDWQPDWRDKEEEKYTITSNGEYLFVDKVTYDTFSQFGYFKYEKECKKALELFEIELYNWLNYEER